MWCSSSAPPSRAWYPRTAKGKWGQQGGSEIPWGLHRMGPQGSVRVFCLTDGAPQHRFPSPQKGCSLQPWSHLMLPPFIPLVLEEMVAKCGLA